MNLFVSLASFVGGLLSSVGTAGCVIMFIDEPIMPSHLIEK